MISEIRGTPCNNCDGMGGHLNGLCIRCNALRLGEGCEKCSSPWIYIHAFMSETKPRVPLCKPCCYAYIKLCGYADDLPLLLERMRKEAEAEKKASLKPVETEVVPKEIPEDNQEYLTFSGS